MQRVRRMGIHTLSVATHPSRDDRVDTWGPHPNIENPTQKEAFPLIEEFSRRPSRSKLVLELEDGTLIGIWPTLSNTSKMVSEGGSLSDSGIWDMAVEIIPPQKLATHSKEKETHHA